LYYRLKVITLRLPPLRDRPEDIPDLLDHFLKRYGKNHILEEETARALATYRWPGNVRELENCVQHMVGVAQGQMLKVSDLHTAVLNHVLANRSDVLHIAEALGTAVPGESGLKSLADVVPASIVPLPELERRAICEALRFTKGDRTTAAALLGIGRTTLYRKLKQYGIEAGRSDFDKM
ncbi:MAG TPA: helix-turn-helix domain-containing protein, partial [Bryobacteraceae bacterium]|nr:helix-turn-helix domain-containing protein [Bryobacteraceae bacterium]